MSCYGRPPLVDSDIWSGGFAAGSGQREGGRSDLAAAPGEQQVRERMAAVRSIRPRVNGVFFLFSLLCISIRDANRIGDL